jgi:hypothetical protein
MDRHIAIVAAVVLIAAPLPAQAQNAQAFANRFAAANTTKDGCLTRTQAELGLPIVAQLFSEIDVEMRGCVTLAEVTAFLRGGRSAQQQPLPPPQPAPEPSAPPPSRSRSLRFSDRFAEANTTDDGCLTLEQAQQSLPGVAKDFAQIDTEGQGCLTMDQIRAYWRNHGTKRQEQPVALPKDMPPPPAGY